MKNVLMKFADNVLSKNEMKSLKGGYGGGGGACGSCWNYGGGGGAIGCNDERDWMWQNPKCVCPGGGAQACG
jgi:hypothetical protein